MNQRAFILAAFVLSANLLTACGSDPVAPAPADSDVASITVTPALDTLEISTSVQLTATVKDAAGNTLTNLTVTWL